MAEPPSSVLMTTDAVGGVWTYSIALACELSRYRVTTTLVVLGPPPSNEQRRRAMSVPHLRMVECAEALEWMDDPWEGVARSGEALLRVARDLSPDLVHLNGYSHAALPFQLPTLVVAHSCVLSWWEAVKGVPAPQRYARYRLAVTEGLARARKVVAPSNAMLRALRRHYGLDGGEVIFNGMEHRESHDLMKQNIVLCVGRMWDEAKNVVALSAAAKGLTIPVYVAGPGCERVEGLTSLGVLRPNQLDDWYARAAIYASPAYYEPFGLATLEAASWGAALVLGDTESQRELWGDAALYVAPTDTAALRGAIELLARDSELRQVMSNRARKKARKYSLVEQGRRYFELYSRLQRNLTQDRMDGEEAGADHVAV